MDGAAGEALQSLVNATDAVTRLIDSGDKLAHLLLLVAPGPKCREAVDAWNKVAYNLDSDLSSLTDNPYAWIEKEKHWIKFDEQQDIIYKLKTMRIKGFGPEYRILTDVLHEAIHQIEMLRKLGNELVQVMQTGTDAGWDKAIDAWKEANA